MGIAMGTLMGIPMGIHMGKDIGKFSAVLEDFSNLYPLFYVLDLFLSPDTPIFINFRISPKMCVLIRNSPKSLFSLGIHPTSNPPDHDDDDRPGSVTPPTQRTQGSNIPCGEPPHSNFVCVDLYFGLLD